MKEFYKDRGLGILCGLAGKSRQAFYAYTNRLEKAQFDSAIIVDLVTRERQVAERVGGKKLYSILKKELKSHNIDLGRDKFLEVLRENDLLVRRRRKRIITTLSRHYLRRYPNLTKELEIDRAEQLWVSDITYIKVGDTTAYLILITDAYSRKVMGYNFGWNMNTEFCLEALSDALVNRCFAERELMHHSDRGMQYCSKAYVCMLQTHQISISMTENGNPLENALAERMNGIFKDNFGLDKTFESFEQAKQHIQKAVEYYNTRLPHSSVDMMTPDQAHQHIGELKKHWKYYWKNKQPKDKDQEDVTSNQSQS